MSDRLTEIRARLDAATFPHWRNYKGHDEPRPRVVFERWPAPEYWTAGYDNPIDTDAQATLCRHAPSDIAWLLAEVDRLEKRVAMYEVVKS